MRIAIIGAGGFLGRHVLAAAEKSSTVAGVAVLDRDDTSSGSALRSVLAAEQVSAVVNCAGRVSGPAGELVQDGVDLVARLVEVLGDSRAGTRLVHLGSAAEYGPVTTDLVAPAAPTCPGSLYGALKLAATHLVLDAVSRQRIDGCVLRVFNPVGAGAPASTLVGKVARHLVLDPRAPLRLGSLAGARDYVAAADVAEAAILAATSQSVPALMNVGRGATTSTTWVVDELARLAGWSGELITDAVGVNHRSEPGRAPAADISLTTTCLGWRPVTSVSDALADCLSGVERR